MTHSDYHLVLDDAQRLRKHHPARKLVVPGIVLVRDEIRKFFDPLARGADQHDGCSAYIVHGGKTFRLTIERL